MVAQHEVHQLELEEQFAARVATRKICKQR